MRAPAPTATTVPRFAIGHGHGEDSPRHGRPGDAGHSPRSGRGFEPSCIGDGPGGARRVRGRSDGGARDPDRAHGRRRPRRRGPVAPGRGGGAPLARRGSPTRHAARPLAAKPSLDRAIVHLRGVGPRRRAGADARLRGGVDPPRADAGVRSDHDGPLERGRARACTARPHQPAPPRRTLRCPRQQGPRLRPAAPSPRVRLRPRTRLTPAPRLTSTGTSSPAFSSARRTRSSVEDTAPEPADRASRRDPRFAVDLLGVGVSGIAATPDAASGGGGRRRRRRVVRASSALAAARSGRARRQPRRCSGAHVDPGHVGGGRASRPWQATRSEPFAVTLRADYLLVRESATHYDSDDPSPVTTSRWLSGVDTFLDGELLLSSADRGRRGRRAGGRVGAHLHLCEGRSAWRRCRALRAVVEAGFQLRF